MPVCIRCGNNASHRSEFLGWKLITKEGIKRVTSRDVRNRDAFFDHPQNMVWENERMTGLCPNCFVFQKFKVNLTKRLEVVIRAPDVHDMLEIVKTSYPRYGVEEYTIVSDNTS